MKKRLGPLIRQLRQKKQLGVRQAASMLDISPSYLSRLETEDECRPPSEEVLRRMAELFEGDFDELMRLAGRVGDEFQEMFRKDPALPQFLRQMRERNLSAKEAMRIMKKEPAEG